MDELDTVILYSQALNIIIRSALYDSLPAVSSTHRLPPATISRFLCATTATRNWVTRDTCQTSAPGSARSKGSKTLPTSLLLCSLTTLCPSRRFSNQGFAEFQ